MKNVFLLFPFLLLVTLSTAQDDKMTNEKLHTIFTEISQEMEGTKGSWQFIIDSTYFICLTDETHNRMRIISPIIETTEMNTDQIGKCMEANFHTVLDTKYAISDGVLWSVFIHPLAELTEEQVLSAILQVYSGAKTFGTHYSSGLLSFPKNEEKKQKKEKRKSKKS